MTVTISMEALAAIVGGLFVGAVIGHIIGNIIIARLYKRAMERRERQLETRGP